MCRSQGRVGRTAVLGSLIGAIVSLGLVAMAPAAPGDATASRVADINNGSANSSPRDLFNAGGTLLFSADDGLTGTELWKSDGGPLGPGGTQMVANIQPGSGGSNPAGFTSIGSTVFFTANDGSSPNPGEHGNELWKIAPPYTTPVMVDDINTTAGVGSFPDQLTNVGGTLFFRATNGSDGVELWKLPFPYTTPEQVENIDGAATDSFPDLLTNVDGTLFFTAVDGTDGQELWKSEGPEYDDASTDLVKDINVGGDANPDHLTAVSDTLFFSADDGVDGQELWKSVGPGYDAGSTTMVENINGTSADSLLADLTDVNGTLFFEADEGSGQDLWKLSSPYTDAQPIDVNPTGASDPEDLTNFGGALYLAAHGTTGGTEPWRSNGGPVGAGTKLIADINPITGSNPADITQVQNQLFFRADSDNPFDGDELWKTTGLGATKVSDINPSADPTIQELTDVNGTLFFQADDGLTGRELWKATIEPAPPPPKPPPTTSTPAPVPVPASGPAPATAEKKKCKTKKHGKKRAGAAKKKRCKKRKGK